MSKPLLHAFDSDKCRGDGICAEICPRDAIEIVDKKAQTVAERAALCIRCGQCVAVCPNEALELDSLPGDRFASRGRWDFGYDDLMAFLSARRAVRTFADKPVDRKLLDQILAASATAPPAVPPHRTGILVLDQRQDLDELATALVEGYDKLLGYFKNPLMRGIIRLKRGPETFHSLKTHAIDIVRDKNARHRKSGADLYTYRAPALLLFHSSRWVAGYQASVVIAASYAMLAAHSLGLGTTYLDIVPPIINNLRHDLRDKYGIPPDHTVVAALIVGHPKYKYRRVVQRQLERARYLRD